MRRAHDSHAGTFFVHKQIRRNDEATKSRAGEMPALGFLVTEVAGGKTKAKRIGADNKKAGGYRLSPALTFANVKIVYHTCALMSSRPCFTSRACTVGESRQHGDEALQSTSQSTSMRPGSRRKQCGNVPHSSHRQSSYSSLNNARRCAASIQQRGRRRALLPPSAHTTPCSLLDSPGGSPFAVR